jgi:ferritin-like metal-binding protein YciE
MTKIDSLETLLVDELRDLLDAEKQLTKSLPKMAKAANNDDLRAAFEKHLEQTTDHIERLTQAFDALGSEPKAKRCAGIRGIIEEGSEHLEMDGDEAALDAAIIGAAQKVEHYEIAAYGTAATHARRIGEDRVAALLEQTLREEKDTDRKLTEIAEQHGVNTMAAETHGRGNGRTGRSSSSGSHMRASGRRG